MNQSPRAAHVRFDSRVRPDFVELDPQGWDLCVVLLKKGSVEKILITRAVEENRELFLVLLEK
jgi:hypothetical protein